MKNKENNNRVKGIIIALLFGLGISLLVMAILIWFGYNHAYHNNLEEYDVKFLGINIYHMVKDQARYIGSQKGTNMGIVTSIVMLLSVIIQETISKINDKK